MSFTDNSNNKIPSKFPINNNHNKSINIKRNPIKKKRISIQHKSSILNTSDETTSCTNLLTYFIDGANVYKGKLTYHSAQHIIQLINELYANEECRIIIIVPSYAVVVT